MAQSVDVNARATRLLADEEAWARRALTRSNKAWWTASLSGKAADYRRMESADRAVNRHYSRARAYQQLRQLGNVGDLDPSMRRRIQRMSLAYQSKQAPVEMLDRITLAESAVQETYSTFRAHFDGH